MMNGSRSIALRIALLILGCFTAWLIVPYAITTFGSYSLCIREGGFSDANDKIQGVRDFLQTHTFEKDNLILKDKKDRSCCLVSKGQKDLPKLNWFSYFSYHKSHYVEIINIVKDKYSIFIVDNCGTVISEGIDL